MKNIYKYVTIATIFLIVGVGLGHTYSGSRKKETPKISNHENKIPISNPINNNGALSSNYNSKSVVPFSSDIVIYNSHADEGYPSGIKVTDVGELLNIKLIKEGVRSTFIKFDPPVEYTKAYQSTRDVITKNVKNYNNTVLLDIHRAAAETNTLARKKILFTLVKDSPYYESNKKYANLLLKEIEKSTSTEVKPEIFEYKKGVLYFNQDLSNHSLLIEIGNEKSDDSDIGDCASVLVSAVKNIQKGSSN